MPTTVVNIHKKSYDVYIGRRGHGFDGYFGNPFPLEHESKREEVLAQFKQYFYMRLGADPQFRQQIETLQDKRLGCFCKPKPCHGDVIAEYLNSLPTAGQ